MERCYSEKGKKKKISEKVEDFASKTQRNKKTFED